MTITYFLSEDERKTAHSTCFYEFHKGKWDENNPVFWKEDSLCISDDVMNSLGLDNLLSCALDNYHPFGETKIDAKRWKRIYSDAEQIGGSLFEAILEVTPWVEDNFKQYTIFTILGI